MDAIWEATLNGYVKLLYDNDPQGSLLKRILKRSFVKLHKNIVATQI